MENSNNEVLVNDIIVRRLEQKIISLENENLKSKELSETKIVDKIKKMIEEEVQCSLNQ